MKERIFANAADILGELGEIQHVRNAGFIKEGVKDKMPKRAKSICSASGCNALIDKPGYCEKHQLKRAALRLLDEKKTPEQKRFYSSLQWTKASLRHRQLEPLCRKCKAEGIVKEAELVHHNPDLQTLIDQGKNPFDDRYLESMCFNHHQKELRVKRK